MRMASLDEAITRSSPSGPASISPDVATSRTSTQRSLSRVRSSTTSKSSTRLSASCTSVRASTISRVMTLSSQLLRRRQCERSRGRALSTARLQAELVVQDIEGGFGQIATVTEGVGPEPDQRVRHAHVELGRQYPRRLVHHVMELAAFVELGRQSAGWGA